MTPIRQLRIANSTALLFSILACLTLLLDSAQAQTPGEVTKRTPQSRVSRSTPVGRNPQITRLVREIDARNIERTIRQLVSFGTRNTLSAQDNPNRGVGAARDWLFSEFSKAAEASVAG